MLHPLRAADVDIMMTSQETGALGAWQMYVCVMQCECCIQLALQLPFSSLTLAWFNHLTSNQGTEQISVAPFFRTLSVLMRCRCSFYGSVRQV